VGQVKQVFFLSPLIPAEAGTQDRGRNRNHEEHKEHEEALRASALGTNKVRLRGTGAFSTEPFVLFVIFVVNSALTCPGSRPPPG
jgi:hypothetical protein